MITSLAMQTNLYRRWFVHDLDRLLVPALMCGQCKIYFSQSGNPSAFVTWAFLNNEDHEQMLANGSEPNLFENGPNPDISKWTTGKNLWFMDAVALDGNIMAITRELRKTHFPDHEIANSIRRNPDGTIRKCNMWRKTRQANSD